jgi:hypothetical protein
MKNNNCDPKIEYFEGIKILVKLYVEVHMLSTDLESQQREII